MVIFRRIQYSNVFIFFRLRKRRSIKCIRKWWEYGVPSKMPEAASGGRGCHASCVRTHLNLSSCSWQQFCLIVPCFFYRNLTLVVCINGGLGPQIFPSFFSLFNTPILLLKLSICSFLILFILLIHSFHNNNINFHNVLEKFVALNPYLYILR